MQNPPKTLFIGLITFDIIYQVKQVPTSNEKIVSHHQLLTCGGPATNAAITFSHLSGVSSLMASLGQHDLSSLICNELSKYQVDFLNLSNQTLSPTISSIMVTESTGERAVVSVNAKHKQCKQLPVGFSMDKHQALFVDGHQIQISIDAAQIARQKQYPVIFDGGSWKTNTEQLLPHVTHAICSENFHPPNCNNIKQTLNYLKQFNISSIAITRGEKSIIIVENEIHDEITPPQLKVIDTLGAGDIFHGAFCYYYLTTHNFKQALQQASIIATKSCQFFGTRQWME
ncbi:MAG: sugar kinase [Methylococcales bacterium]|jgi:sugar/nucleoside kinase (ribokinase family)|nr:sugar kinase [Methylococcales bacterium]MBT7411421.1 sugar kinase [Methylococcales bacterium]